ncbi:MAG: hypothetical protein IJS67_01515, partial [Clostridia bacterium]|nr:hypothetical protein [Clostridia bacterium]
MDNQLIGQLFGADISHFAGVQRALDDGAEVLYAEEDGLCLKLKNSDIYMLYGCKDEDAAERAISFVFKPSAVVCSNRSEVNAARDKFASITKTKLCLQVRYEKPAGIECPEGIEVKKLPVLGEIVDFVTATYSLHYP